MEARTNRKALEDRFIQQVLREEGNKIKIEQLKFMSSRGFTSTELLTKINTVVNNTTLQHTHLTRHRFIDMKTRNTRQGKIKKKNHPIHNRILFGHMNNVVRRLSFGFTEDVVAQIKGELENQNF